MRIVKTIYILQLRSIENFFLAIDLQKVELSDALKPITACNFVMFIRV